MNPIFELVNLGEKREKNRKWERERCVDIDETTAYKYNVEIHIDVLVEAKQNKTGPINLSILNFNCKTRVRHWIANPKNQTIG